MPTGPFPDVVEIVVEIPRGSRNKYEYDEHAGVYRLDRVLSSAVFYNFDYGFIEGTRAGDGDHTDALLVIDEPTFTGCHVWARPIGGLEMRDEKGFDFKVLCVAIGDAQMGVVVAERQAYVAIVAAIHATPVVLAVLLQLEVPAVGVDIGLVAIVGQTDRQVPIIIAREDHGALAAAQVADDVLHIVLHVGAAREQRETQRAAHRRSQSGSRHVSSPRDQPICRGTTRGRT